MRLDRISRAIAFALALFALDAALPASSAQAQCMPSMTCNRVGADGKGALGGGILGAEIGFITTALIVHAGAREIDEWWAWILFPAIGAAGGAVAGYFGLEDPTQMGPMGTVTRGFPEVAVAVFAVSMALIVPTFVGVLALTAYSPGPDQGGSGATGDEDAGGADEGVPDEPAAEPEEGAQSAIERVMAGGPGLLRFDRGRVLLGVPMAHGADTYTDEERARLLLPMSADLRVPLVSGTF
ncbi:MAG TPA: hypothetical protein VIL20_26230 [Sandaracinaceae bacterium]